MTTIPFVKMHGAGNDFVMVDAGDLPAAVRLDTRMIAGICARRTGVGADGLIVVTPVADDTVRMSYYNADGGEADMCGNGARCTAAFAHARGHLGSRGNLETRCGRLAVRMHAADDVEVDLPAYRGLRHGITVNGSPFGEHHVCDTGVPHLVIPVDGIDAVDVVGQGRTLREHAAFAPAGVNVNWVERARDGDEWRLRTYERGVEAETLACGTGASAAATVVVSLGLASSPVAIRTRGGDLLMITVDLESGGLRLRGPAVVAYSGRVETDE